MTFGKPIPLTGWTADARRDVMDLAHLVRDTIGRLHKVLPTAVLAAAMRPSIEQRDLENRAEEMIGIVRAAGANLGVTSGREAVELGTPMLADRGIIHVERGGLFRVRERTVLRYYARTLQHLLTGPGRLPAPTDDRVGLEGVLPLASPAADSLKSLASRYGMRQPRSFARRFIAGETVEEAIAAAREIEAARHDPDAGLSRRERRVDGGGRQGDARVSRRSSSRSPPPESAATSH